MGLLKLGRPMVSLILLTGCSVAGGLGPSRPAPTPAASPAGTRSPENRPPNAGRNHPAGTPTGTTVDVGLAVVEVALEAVGTPYRWGGTGSSGFDCSGLIRFSYGEFGIELPRISRDQINAGAPVALDVGSLRPGDVLGFSAEVGGGVTHVGLYIGDGEFIHSATSGVRISNLREPYWQRHFIAASRMVG